MTVSGSRCSSILRTKYDIVHTVEILEATFYILSTFYFLHLTSYSMCICYIMLSVICKVQNIMSVRRRENYYYYTHTCIM